MEETMKTEQRVMTACLGAILLLLNVSYAGPIASSTFDTGNEGWLVVSTEGYVGPANWSPTGGNPGGYIYDTDMDNGGWGFLAPSKFLGDVSAAYGQTLTFDFTGDRIEHEYAGVALANTTGIGIITHVALPDYPGHIASREIVLDASQEWYVFNYNTGDEGGLATNAEIQATLSDLAYLFLGAEFAPGFDNDGEYEYGEFVAYDNIILVPEPGAILLFSLGALFIPKRRKLQTG